METLLATQITPNFAKISKNLQKGKRFGILYGRTKKPVAMLVPFEEKAKIEFASDFGKLKPFLNTSNWKFNREEANER